jgi:hypothetical protein
MKPIRLVPPSYEAVAEQAELYWITLDTRVRTRVQLVLLAREQGLSACEIAVFARQYDQTVRNWFKRYQVEGILFRSLWPG